MIILDTSHYKMSAHMAKGLRKQIREWLEVDGKVDIGRSGSGQSIAYAVEWAEENKRSYQITGHPGMGYHFQLIPGIGD